MIAEFLRHPSSTARAAERPHGFAGGLPDLTRAELIAALQPRHEDGVGPDSTHAEVSHNRSPLSSAAGRVLSAITRFCRRTTRSLLVPCMSMRLSAAPAS